MKVRTLFVFIIFILILPLDILAAEKEIPKYSPSKIEESVQSRKRPEEQQVNPQLADLESKKQAYSLLLKEAALCEAQKSFDRSLSNISTLITIFAVVLTVLGVIVAFTIGLGLLDYFTRRRILKAAEQSRDEARKAALEAKNEVRAIKELKQRAEEELEKERKSTPELVKIGAEKPTEDYIKKLDEFGRRLDLIEVLGVPLKAEDYLKRGNLFFTRNEFEKAITSYDKAIELDPNSSNAWMNKGATLGKLDQYEKALSATDKAIELDPKNVDAWINKGIALGKSERYDESLLALDKAIELDPKNLNAWINKGIALGELERYDESLLALDKAIELNPKDARTHYNRACTYSLKGEKANFMNDLKRSVELDPKLKKTASEDEDFKRFWDDDDFKRIVQ